jgi:hypothetical protein
MNRKSFRNAVAAALVACTLAACNSSKGSDDRTSTSAWWGNNMRGYWYVLKRDATDIYRGIDRHFFNYDWEDPYIN